MLPVTRKDVLPTTLKSSVIYEYLCHCDSRYVGKTSQRLRGRIRNVLKCSKWLQTASEAPYAISTC